MKYNLSLRFRITLTFFLFGTMLMVAVATGVHYAIEGIETRVIQENLEKELQNFKQHYKNNPDQPLPHSASMTAYLIEASEESRLPEYVRDLKPGTHEIKQNDKYLQIIVDKLNGKTMALVLDATIFEKREKSIESSLIIAVISASLLALWIGYALSQKAIAPVTNLAKTVAVLEPGKPASQLASTYGDDEVGELARAFDHYLERLQDFIAREQEFTGNASHELRTPLTIIKGAVEIISADTDLSSHSRKVLQRIKRAVDGMSQMVETLLVLAREDKITEEPVPSVAAIAQTVITESNDLLGGKPVKLEMLNMRDFGLHVPPSIITILLSNLLRNAIAYTREGSISISVNSPLVMVTDTGRGISEEALPLIFDRHYRNHDNETAGSGIGLSIVKRICNHYNWLIDVKSTPDKGTVVTLDFGASITSAT
jgi:signal transduction histidine kinase